MFAYKCGTYASRNFTVGHSFCIGDKLYNISSAFRICNVRKRNFRYALTRNKLGINMSAVRKGSENTDLSARVVTLDVGCRVLFGIAQLLRGFQRRIKRLALINHFSQNEIGCSV